MEIVKIIENEDGSALVDILLSEEENQLLLNYAIIDILKKACHKGSEE